MKLKPRQVALCAGALLFLMAGLWVYLSLSHPQRAVAAYKRKLLAAGEKLTVDELLPERVPFERNSVEVFNQSRMARNLQGSLLDTNAPSAMRMVAPGRALVRWAQADVRDETTNSWAEAEAALARDYPALQLLEGIIERPALDFHLDYRQGFDLLLPHLSALKQTAQRLSYSAAFELHRGDSEAAALKVRTMLAIAKGMADERLVISQLVRIAIAHIALAANWELLQSSRTTDEQLAALQRDWAELEFSPAVENALLMERALAEMTLTRMRNSSAAFKRVANGWGSSTPGSSGNWFEQAAELTVLKTKEAVWQYAWSYPDQLNALEGHEAVIEAIRQFKKGGPFKVALQNQEKRLTELGIVARSSDSDSVLFNFNDMDLRSLFSHSVLSLQSLLHRVLVAEAGRRMTLTAIALERYQLRHGSYPPDLAALGPDFLRAIPRDPVDGENLRYRLNPDGTFLLYSIGEDGEDNGGDASSAKESKAFSWTEGRDLVWPQPATPAEIAAYYQKLIARRGTEASAEAFTKRYGLAATDIANTNSLKDLPAAGQTNAGSPAQR